MENGTDFEFPGFEQYFMVMCPHGHYSFCPHGCFVDEDVKQIIVAFQKEKTNVATTRLIIDRALALKYEEARNATRDLSVIYSEINELEAALAEVMVEASKLPPYDESK